MRYKIVLIVPYFGQLPPWMDCYLFSCKMNPQFDFIFYTDNLELKAISSNIKIKTMTFQEYCDLVSRSLNINFSHSNPYKLCDLKPYYGYIHQHEIKNYDFWGFSDIDLIYGKLDNFITDKILETSDFISSMPSRVSGHFFLMRNIESVVLAPFKVKEYKDMLECKQYCHIDEALLTDVLAPHYRAFEKSLDFFVKIPLISYYIYETLRYILYLKPMQILLRFKKKRLFFKNQWSTPGPSDTMKFEYHDGQIFDKERKSKEMMYLHFLHFKKKPNISSIWDNATFTSMPSTEMIIDKYGIHNL
jgi:hypothetical protein